MEHLRTVSAQRGKWFVGKHSLQGPRELAFALSLLAMIFLLSDHGLAWTFKFLSHFLVLILQHANGKEVALAVNIPQRMAIFTTKIASFIEVQLSPQRIQLLFINFDLLISLPPIRPYHLLLSVLLILLLQQFINLLLGAMQLFLEELHIVLK